MLTRQTRCINAVAVAAMLAALPLRADLPAPAFVNETEKQMTASGDFDGDGRRDVALVEKDSGRVRLAFQTEPGTWTWVEWRAAGTKFVSGMSVGRLLAPDKDALAFASADANLLTIADASNVKQPPPPLTVPLTVLGPNSVVALDIGGAENTPLADLALGSIYNSDPTPNLLQLLRNRASQVGKLDESPLPGPLTRANRVRLKSGGPELLAAVISGDATDTLWLGNLASGKPAMAVEIKELPTGTEYVVGRFGGSPLATFVAYKAGGTELLVRPITEAGAGYAAGPAAKFALPQPVRQLLVVGHGEEQRLLALFEEAEKAGVFTFDGKTAPVLAQTINAPPDEAIWTAAALDQGFVLFTAPAAARSAERFHFYPPAGAAFDRTRFGTLPTLADNDTMTVPEIHKLVLANHKVATPAEMKGYTNAIPGTDVTYSMLPIPSGEFLMGSPDTQANRNADEGPQHKVKLSPFWMAQFEVTWDMYQLFMYPDDERRLRALKPANEDVDKISDIVSRPSRPYVEMSFGMGKDGFPAIAMTHHAANKFCHWLSARTGHFYRLPTEAEWEYACRAGTDSAYYFGDVAEKLPDYAWFFENSDSKYQKVGSKKPNPWGLFDMSGNVFEWCLDQFDPNYYQVCAAKGVVENPWNKATTPYPHVVRGGSWDDDAPWLRSTARRGSEKIWKMTDPQLPKSMWYLSDSRVVGFRMVRPLKVPAADEMQRYWNSGTEKE
jgi:formylglycine-generating enzyme required for sulfatase activity